MSYTRVQKHEVDNQTCTHHNMLQIRLKKVTAKIEDLRGNADSRNEELRKTGATA